MPRNIALIVGINNYLFLPQLKYAQKDAELMGKFLNENAGFSAENICLCTNNSEAYQGYSTRPRRTELRYILRQCFNEKFLTSEAG